MARKKLQGREERPKGRGGEGTGNKGEEGETWMGRKGRERIEERKGY